MGQQPNKIYTAPDGSVYRVENDGSVTKIKGGRVQSNEPPSKYYITPDGKIYRVESDGSVTYLGIAEERSAAQHSYINNTRESKGDKHSWVWILFLLIVIGVIGAIAVSNMNDYTLDSQNEQWAMQTEQTEVNQEVIPDLKLINETDYTEEAPGEEVPADDNSQYAFIVDGRFYGTIANSLIRGSLILDTENPSGILYYSNGNVDPLEIYGTSDALTWEEYYNGYHTGHINFTFWDLAYKNFARGTYTRCSDGKQFSIKLYKTNF